MACSRTAPRRLDEGMPLEYSTVRTVLYYKESGVMRVKGMGYDTGFTIGSDSDAPASRAGDRAA